MSYKEKFEQYLECIELADFKPSGGALHFDKIPDLVFLDALFEFSGALELFFPLDYVLGNIQLIAEQTWAGNVRQARLESDLFSEDDNSGLSEIRNMIVEVELKDGAYFHDDHISSWKDDLVNWDALTDFDIFIWTTLNLSRLSEKTRERREKLEETQSHIASSLRYGNNGVRVHPARKPKGKRRKVLPTVES